MASHVILNFYGLEADINLRQGSRDTRGRIRFGTMGIIPEGHDGRYDIYGPIEVSHVYLTDTRLQACATAVSRRQRVELMDRVAFDDPIAARILSVLELEASLNLPSSRLFLEQAIDLLCLQLVRGHSSEGGPVLVGGGRLAAWQVKRVMDYMKANLHEEVSLDELAGVISLSRFHFCSAFRRTTGRTPHEMLTHLRIDRACELLADPDRSVTSVAFSVGYESHSGFSASFRRTVGVSPSQYRRGI